MIFSAIALISKAKAIFSIASWFKGGKAAKTAIAGNKTTSILIVVIVLMGIGGFGLNWYNGYQLDKAQDLLEHSKKVNSALEERNSIMQETTRSAVEESKRLKSEIKEINSSNRRIKGQLKELGTKYESIRIESAKSGLEDGPISPSLKNTLQNLTLAR